MPIFVYIDESGDLGFHPKSSSHIIITALFISDFSKLDRIIKNFRRNVFRNELKNSFEIKSNKVSELLIRRLLIKLNEIPDIKITHIILDKKTVQTQALEKNKHQFYDKIVSEIAKHIPFEEVELEIRIDKSKNKKILRDEFNNYFENILKSHSSCRIAGNIIHHSDSKMWSGIQFADVLAWAEYQKIVFGKIDFISLIDKEKQEEYKIGKEVFQENRNKK